MIVSHPEINESSGLELGSLVSPPGERPLGRGFSEMSRAHAHVISVGLGRPLLWEWPLRNCGAGRLFSPFTRPSAISREN